MFLLPRKLHLLLRMLEPMYDEEEPGWLWWQRAQCQSLLPSAVRASSERESCSRNSNYDNEREKE